MTNPTQPTDVTALARECALRVSNYMAHCGHYVHGANSIESIIAAAFRPVVEERDRLFHAMHECYAATGEEAGDADDFRALVQRERVTVEAVREMRKDADQLRAEAVAAKDAGKKATGATMLSIPAMFELMTTWDQQSTDVIKHLRAALDAAEGAGKALIARLEATQGQAFYDMVQPELIALEQALARSAAVEAGKS